MKNKGGGRGSRPPGCSLSSGFIDTQRKTFDKISQNGFHLVELCDGAARQEKQAEKPSTLKRPSLHPLCFPLSMMDTPEGEFYMTPCGFLNLYRVCLLNHKKKNYRHLQGFLALYSL